MTDATNPDSPTTNDESIADVYARARSEVGPELTLTHFLLNELEESGATVSVTAMLLLVTKELEARVLTLEQHFIETGEATRTVDE